MLDVVVLLCCSSYHQDAGVQTMLRLISIRFSHYNEKARWALDRFAVPYQEEPYMPIFHLWPVFWKTLFRKSLGKKADRVSSPLSTPVLILEDGSCLCDSALIVKYVSEHFSTPDTSLYPSEEVVALEQHVHDMLGPHTRRVAYFYGLADPALMFDVADKNVSASQAAWFRRVYPLVKGVIMRNLRVSAEAAEKSLRYVEKEFADIEQRLADGRRYLLHDRFTAADLAFACMSAPILLPTQEEGYGAYFPPQSALPAPLVELIQKFRLSTAGQFALRMFREERHA